MRASDQSQLSRIGAAAVLTSPANRSSFSPRKLKPVIEVASKVEQCPFHKQTLEHYCCRCQSQCCGLCACELTGAHASHHGEVHSVAHAAQACRAKLATLIHQCSVQLRVVETELAALRVDESSLSSSLESALAHIDEMTTALQSTGMTDLTARKMKAKNALQEAVKVRHTMAAGRRRVAGSAPYRREAR